MLRDLAMYRTLTIEKQSRGQVVANIIPFRNTETPAPIDDHKKPNFSLVGGSKTCQQAKNILKSSSPGKKNDAPITQ